MQNARSRPEGVQAQRRDRERAEQEPTKHELNNNKSVLAFSLVWFTCWCSLFKLLYLLHGLLQILIMSCRAMKECMYIHNILYTISHACLFRLNRRVFDTLDASMDDSPRMLGARAPLLLCDIAGDLQFVLGTSWGFHTSSDNADSCSLLLRPGESTRPWCQNQKRHCHTAPAVSTWHDLSCWSEAIQRTTHCLGFQFVRKDAKPFWIRIMCAIELTTQRLLDSCSQYGQVPKVHWPFPTTQYRPSIPIKKVSDGFMEKNTTYLWAAGL